jgi:hypothetical protein
MQVVNSGRGRVTKALGVALLASLPAALATTAHATAPSSTLARLQDTWRETIRNKPTPGDGCFSAAYPSTAWTRVACSTKPAIPFIPRHGHGAFTVGNGNDYAAVVSSLISNGVGSFPSVTGVTKETGYGGQTNTYSLQLNSQFFTSAACNGHSGCLGWQQFVYSTSEGIAFMQYWLINYGSRCPTGGWSSYSGSCYKNSSEVSVPLQVISQLPNLKVTGKAVSGGSDTITLTTASHAYSATGSDTVTYLANSWKEAEFNIVGDGGGSAAKFNKGSKLTVNTALTDGATSAPTCESNDGTTGETNNLTLGSCTTAGGSTPSIQFTESD